jgi:hypothetical protein
MAIQAPKLNYENTVELVIGSILAGRTPCVWGAPGIGKTAISSLLEKDPRVQALATVKVVSLNKLIEKAKEAATSSKANGKVRTVTFIASNCDSVDLAGIPVPDVADKLLLRFLIEEIEIAVREPVILIIDEFTTVPPSVQGPLLRLILERVAGNKRLHDNSRIVCLANPPEQAPGAFDLSAATMNRLVHVELVPAAKETAKWFTENVGELGSALREEACLWAACVAVNDGILQFNPPAGAIAGRETWGSPRAWHAALDVSVTLRELNSPKTVINASIEGSVGNHAAGLFKGTRKVKDELPSVEEVVADPRAAKLPANKAYQVAVIAILARVGTVDSFAAWIYASRLAGEFRLVAIRTIFGVADLATPTDSPWKKEGEKLATKLMGEAKVKVVGKRGKRNGKKGK